MKKERDELIAQAVLNWYKDYWDTPMFPFFKRAVISQDTSLSTGKYQLLWEDAEDLLVEYFEKFNVEQRDFAFNKYWPTEQAFCLIPLFWKKKTIEAEPLTVEMLMQSAVAGYWLYD